MARLPALAEEALMVALDRARTLPGSPAVLEVTETPACSSSRRDSSGGRRTFVVREDALSRSPVTLADASAASLAVTEAAIL